MANDKRARKKEHRDAVVAQREAMLRRRRMARLGAVATVIALIVAAAVISGGGGADDEDKGNDPAAASAEPSAEETGGGQGGAVACGAEAPPKPEPQQYQQAEQVLEDGVDYGAVMETSCGTIQIDLYEEEAPITVNNFVFLSQEGFYDGLTFHRVEPQFVIQGGDPQGTGGGGPGYKFEDELWMKAEDYVYGTLSMANAGPDTNGSQFFFIVHKPTDKPAGLAPAYTMFGTIPKGDEDSYATLEAIKQVETSGSTPVQTVYIESVEITEG